MEKYTFAMKMALNVAMLSNDKSTQNGAVITLNGDSRHVAAYGNNDLVSGDYVDIDREVVSQRPLKYKWVEHAERNAIYDAAFNGVELLGATMVCRWAACSDCARGIVQSGIEVLVRYPLTAYGQWTEEVEIGDQILNNAGIAIIEYNFPNVKVPPLLHNGEIWTPNG